MIQSIVTILGEDFNARSRFRRVSSWLEPLSKLFWSYLVSERWFTCVERAGSISVIHWRAATSEGLLRTTCYYVVIVSRSICSRWDVQRPDQALYVSWAVFLHDFRIEVSDAWNVLRLRHPYANLCSRRPFGVMPWHANTASSQKRYCETGQYEVSRGIRIEAHMHAFKKSRFKLTAKAAKVSSSQSLDK